uniref:Uncharacterized protein n=1 Tax=Anguilla anguilla TaxID=7936 RepID=A0A0E9XXY1_ANGAN
MFTLLFIELCFRFFTMTKLMSISTFSFL